MVKTRLGRVKQHVNGSQLSKDSAPGFTISCVHEYMFPLSYLNNSRYPLNRHTWILLMCVCCTAYTWVCRCTQLSSGMEKPEQDTGCLLPLPSALCLHWTWSSPFLSRLAGQWVLRVCLSRPLNAHLTPYTKTNWKQIDQPNVRSKMIKLLEENMNEILIPLDPAMED